ncbi:thiol-disulfide oxidoreductase DCC family protein [Kytococcus sedentarius]|uniref:thiol-disulfide oxidoreductase DCC family protein n=1 Tax=Kytococcus sedentarius TaxID=1276 RepID=UPI0035BC3D81
MSALLYDPDCGFCTRAAELLMRWPVSCEVAPMDPERLAAAGVDAERADREIPFVDDAGGVRYGSAAIAAALRTAGRSTPLGQLVWAAGAVLGNPPVAWVAPHVYRLVAEHRHELPGGTAACAMPPRAV